jgi:DAK2 domain fusion protein YloV
MHLTLRAAVDEARRCESGRADDIAAAMSRGALLGARGNSGVILSQFIRGFAAGLRDRDRIDGAALAAALQEASDAAYRTVPRPVEGTILTVAREGAKAAVDASGPDATPIDVLAAAVDGARAAVADTPRLLPMLAEAGVVDAGGQGLALLLEGALRSLRGEETAGEALALPEAGAIRADWQPAIEAAHGGGSTYGYCTEFLVVATEIDEGGVRQRLEALGDSVIVVRDADMLRAHVHVDDPGAALSIGSSLGRLRQVKVDDMQAQYVDATRERGSRTVPIAVVAVAAGDGLTDVLRSVGATAIVSGGQTMNPSAQDLLDAARTCGSAEVIVLPNNKNIEMAARQAAALADTPIHVVSTRSVPQGIAALLAFDAAQPVERNVERMTAAASTVRTIEVTHAVRDATIDGVTTRTGDAIALVNDVLTTATASADDAALKALEIAANDGCSLVTIYRGQDCDEDAAQGLALLVAERWPDVEVEVVDGGQPHYPYVLSVE